MKDKEKKKSKSQLAQEKTQEALNIANKKIEVLGENTGNLFNDLNNIQEIFDKIRNVPSDKKLEYEKCKTICSNWKQQAEKIEEDYQKATAKNIGKGVVGAGVGVAVMTMGPTAAMGVATTFGVASTGTAISALSGAAATNAALAWLGGGALAAGGGGMAAGEAFLALAGPVGWAIAGVSLVTSGLLLWKIKSEQSRIEEIFVGISDRDTKKYELAVVEISERITRIQDEIIKLKDAIEQIKTFGFDYNSMTEEQQYQLGAYVNLMLASTQLLVNPILGLKPNYTNEDYNHLLKLCGVSMDEKRKNLIVALGNLLYGIDIKKNDSKVLYNALKGNKEFLQAIGFTKKEFFLSDMEKTVLALQYKHNVSLTN